MATLGLQSSAVKGYDTWNGLVFVFSSKGVDIYLPSLVGWQKLGFAALANVTCGAVNDTGIWLGTSDSGVWFVPYGIGNLSLGLVKYYATTETTHVLQSDVVQGMAALDSALLICTDAGAEFFPSVGPPYTYSDASGCTAAAITSTKIAYAVASGLHVLNHPVADWDSGDATVLTTASSPALSNNTVNDLRYGTDLFVGTAAGVDIYDNTDVVTIGSANVNSVWPSTSATKSSGYLGYGTTSDAIIYDLTNSATLETHSGATTAIWLADTCAAAIYIDDLELHAYIEHLSPFADARDVRRDWSLYFEATDSLFGIDGSGIVVKVDGVAVSATVTSLDSGFSSGFSSGFGSGIFKVAYTPASSSGYRKKISVEIVLTNTAGLVYSEIIVFTTTTSKASAPSVSLPPDMTVVKDVSLTSDQAEAREGTIYINWGDEIRSALIVAENQAQKVGTVAVENGTFHKYQRTIRVKNVDANADLTRNLNKGDLLTVTCTALNMAAKKCELLAKQREIKDGVEFILTVAYYEAF